MPLPVTTWSLTASLSSRKLHPPSSLRHWSWAAISRRGEVRVWREEGKRLHLAWQAHSGKAYALALSPHEHTLASGSNDGSVKLWDVERGTLLWSGWHTQGTWRLAFSPDGSRLASASWDRPYERLNITGIQGLTEAQQASLRALGAFEETSVGGYMK